MNTKEWIYLFLFITIVLVIVVVFSEIYSFFKLANETSSLTWTGILSGILSLSLAIFFYYREKIESKKLAKSIEALVTSIDEIKRIQESNNKKQEFQNEKLNNIEKELENFQNKLLSTNLLSIVINWKK